MSAEIIVFPNAKKPVTLLLDRVFPILLELQAELAPVPRSDAQTKALVGTSILITYLEQWESQQ